MIILLGLGWITMTMHVSALETITATDRIVFVGDSITDGFTCPLLVQQALSEAGKPVPKLINAGVGSDTAEMMAKRIERDVLPQRPTLVFLSAGVNDAIRNVSVEAYQKSIKSITAQLQKENIPIVIFTATILGEPNADKEKRIDEFNVFLRAFAAESGYRVADVNALMQAARKSGDQGMIMTDHVHLTFHGYEFMARAALNSLGLGDLSVPTELKPPPYSGLIKSWKFRTAKDALTDQTIREVAVDGTWKSYELPEKQPVTESWWTEHERQRGTAVSVEREFGKSPRYIGVTELEEKAPRSVTFHVGAALDAIWLNGQRIYKASDWRGWHLDRERASAELKAGRNQLVIETCGQFILTMDDGK